MRRARRPFAPQFDQLENISLMATSLGYTPTDFRDAYDLNVTAFKTSGKWVLADGTGQTIAIVDAFHDPDLAADLAKFDATYGLPAVSLTQVDQAGSTTDDGWAEEEALDVEWAHVAAPGAKIVVVEAASDSLADLMAAVNTARNIAGVSVVSMSWGSGEFTGETAYDSYFTTPAGHTPITFIAATGDSSAYAGAEWPASSPDVLAVGGTTLSIASSTLYVSESAWSDGGGGISQVEGEPEYQLSVQSTGVRTTPDVSIDADPDTGYAVYFTAPSTGVGSWEEVGGTSASAQVWAGFIADADQGRALLGLATLDGATQTLPALYAMTSSAFHDVTSGSNGYSATTGYDLATGIGSPIGNMVIPLLASYTGTTALTTTTVTVTGFGGGGRPGPRAVDALASLTASTSTTGSGTTTTVLGTPTPSTTAAIPVTTGASVIPMALPTTTVSPASGTTSQAATTPTPSVLIGADSPAATEFAPEDVATKELFDLVLEMLFGSLEN